jgi:uncharacterized protein YjcR
VAHANARTTFYARKLMVDRRAAGWRPAQIAEQLGVSRQTVHNWLHRYDTEGEAGLVDRSSRPHSNPTRTPAEVPPVARSVGYLAVAGSGSAASAAG